MKKRILLIISGSVAAYKSLDVLRGLRTQGHDVTCVMTKSAEEFITPLSVASLSGKEVYTELFSLKDETEMGHIRLSREADLILVAPATANILAKMTHGQADDLATNILLASDKPIMVAPAMNSKMWENPATQRNIQQLQQDGIQLILPQKGELACGELGIGKLAAVDTIISSVTDFFSKDLPLKGLKALVTSGPTIEAIDPVRYIANRSSGKQGHAIATALAAQGADVTLVTGSVALADPENVHTIHIESADEMLAACNSTLPCDIAICAAAVADWKPAQTASQKIKKQKGANTPTITLTENPDILATLSKANTQRPTLVIGFAAETENLLEHATAKRLRKGCDWLLANDVSQSESTFGSDTNHIYFITEHGAEEWPVMPKIGVAEKLMQEIIHYWNAKHSIKAAS